MTEVKQELQKCTNCRSKMLLSFFGVKATTGIRYKTCNKCRTKDIECKLCDYKCSTNAKLQIHINAVHDKIKDHECKTCNAKFSTTCNLKQHIKVAHNKIKDKECQNCEYKCSHSAHLRAHIKTVHDKIKENECSQCIFICSDAGNLQRHIKALHDKIKDHDCPQCEYKCSSASDLQRHIKSIHDRIKDHECKDCDFKSSTASDLQRHRKICTGKLNISGGELACRKAFELLEIKYEAEVSDIKNDDGKWLRFDFKIEPHGSPMYVEYDGAAHFKPVCFGGISNEKANERFIKQQANDKIKNDYCSTNNIPLLRIPYMRIDDVMEIIREFVQSSESDS